MPALIEVSLVTASSRPAGLLGIPLHGLVFAALERHDLGLSARVHAAEVKPFRIGQSRWLAPDELDVDVAQVDFQVGVLDDALVGSFLEALTPGCMHGADDLSLRAQVLQTDVVMQESYESLYARHAGGTVGREIHLEFLTPTTFRTTDLDMPFPVPKTVFYGLQRRWEHHCALHCGPQLNDWVGRAVRVKDFHLRPRSVYFKGMRRTPMTACVGEVSLEMARPGDYEPVFVRLLADYANYAGVGYKTAFGLGHVEASGWRTPEDP